MVSSSRRERVKELFQISKEDGSIDKRLQHVPTVTVWSSIVGFFLGGRYGASAAARHHIESSQLAVFDSKLDAHRVYHKASLTGFLRLGFKWGWRMGLLGGTYSLLVVVFDQAKGKENALSYIYAGACTGAAYNILSGYRSIVVGTILGSLLSLPCAAVIGGLNAIVPGDWKQMLRESQEKQAEEEKRKMEQDWEKRMLQLGVMVEALKKETETAAELHRLFSNDDVREERQVALHDGPQPN